MSLVNKTYNPVQKLTLKAGEDIVEHRFVDFAGSLCATAQKSLGVSEISWLSGQQISVISIGTAIIETASSVTLGAPITATTDGKAKLATGSDEINGWALDASASAGFIRIRLV